MIAGKFSLDDDEIALFNQQFYTRAPGISLPPEERDIGHVFQNYGLFPHLSVSKNMTFGRMMRKIPEGESAARIREILIDLGIQDLAGVKPGGLS